MELWVRLVIAFALGWLIGVLICQCTGSAAFRKGQRDIAQTNGTIYIDSQTNEMYLELEHEFEPDQNVTILAITRK